MARKASTQLTPLELEIMKILWEVGPLPVEAVRQRMPGETAPAYTTVQTMLNLLEKKGKAKRKLVDRAFVYEAAVTRNEARSSTLTDLINRMFGGSAEELVMGLVETKHLTAEKLAKLQRAVKKESHGSN